MSKLAVVVGINDYTGLDPSGQSNLSACVADAQSVAQLLTSSLGFDPADVTLITDAAATRAAIMSALTTMVHASQPGDVVFFYYSGHGTIIPDDPDTPTCEKFYEAICTATPPFLTDKDLWSVANSLQQSVVNFTVMLDSCHSGGMSQETDASAKFRSIPFGSDLQQRIAQYLSTIIPVGIGIPSNSDVCDNNVSNVGVSDDGVLQCDEDPSRIFLDLAKMTLIAGCRFWELSYEVNGHGLLTQALLDTVNASDFQMSYGDLVTQLQTKVTAAFTSQILPSVAAGDPKSQTPQLRGQANRMGEGFLQAWVESK
jgi:hypothetical protein